MGPGSGRYIWVLSQGELGIGKIWSVASQISRY